jgi:hypothetical protein
MHSLFYRFLLDSNPSENIILSGDSGRRKPCLCPGIADSRSGFCPHLQDCSAFQPGWILPAKAIPFEINKPKDPSGNRGRPDDDGCFVCRKRESEKIHWCHRFMQTAWPVCHPRCYKWVPQKHCLMTHAALLKKARGTWNGCHFAGMAGYDSLLALFFIRD